MLLAQIHLGSIFIYSICQEKDFELLSKGMKKKKDNNFLFDIILFSSARILEEQIYSCQQLYK